MTHKTCGKCREVKPHKDFNKKKREKDGLQPYCRTCDNAHRRAYYKRNKKAWKSYREKSRTQLKEWWKEFKKGLSCEKCGDKRSYLLECHHINPDEKEYNVSEMIHDRRSKEAILKEFDKCEILCPTCHKDFHYFEHNPEEREEVKPLPSGKNEKQPSPIIVRKRKNKLSGTFM